MSPAQDTLQDTRNLLNQSPSVQFNTNVDTNNEQTDQATPANFGNVNKQMRGPSSLEKADETEDINDQRQCFTATSDKDTPADIEKTQDQTSVSPDLPATADPEVPNIQSSPPPQINNQKQDSGVLTVLNTTKLIGMKIKTLDYQSDTRVYPDPERGKTKVVVKV